MNSIRRFVYAAALVLSALNFTPSLASAQDAAGTFTLTHEVHWQNAVVPSGKYRFTVAAGGPGEMLTLRKVDGSAGFMLLVADAENSRPSDDSQLVLVSRPSGSFVSTMQLPESGLTLHFMVPSEPREIAQAVATASAAR
ncbi:MAG: hypothetical protein WBQ85_15750 [Candidatus Sulfotelmatobacter sp.]